MSERLPHRECRCNDTREKRRCALSQCLAEEARRSGQRIRCSRIDQSWPTVARNPMPAPSSKYSPHTAVGAYLSMYSEGYLQRYTAFALLRPWACFSASARWPAFGSNANDQVEERTQNVAIPYRVGSPHDNAFQSHTYPLTSYHPFNAGTERKAGGFAGPGCVSQEYIVPAATAVTTLAVATPKPMRHGFIGYTR